jgi:hypothetical protein
MLPAEPLKQEAPVEPRPLHADHLVKADRRGVVGADEEAHTWDSPEQQPDQIAQPAPAVAAVSDLRVHPDLLELHRLWRPCRSLGLEKDRAVLDPDPGAPLIDLLSRPPPEPGRVGHQRIDSDLPHMRRRASGQEQLEVLVSRSAECGAAWLRRPVDREDRLPVTVLARGVHLQLGRVPEVGHRLLVPDDHPRSGGRRDVGKGLAALAGRHHVRPQVAERPDTIALHCREQPSKASPRGLVEEDAFDWLCGAELEHLLERGFFEMRGQWLQGRRALTPRL